jgi:hypothetical protein
MISIRYPKLLLEILVPRLGRPPSKKVVPGFLDGDPKEVPPEGCAAPPVRAGEVTADHNPLLPIRSMALPNFLIVRPRTMLPLASIVKPLEKPENEPTR